MASRHPRIHSQVVRASAIRGAAALDDDLEAADRARSFLHDVADDRAGLDAESLRSVRERAWG